MCYVSAYTCESLTVVNVNMFMSNSVVACEVSQSLMSDCDHMNVLQFHIRKYALTRTTIDNLVRVRVVMRSECDVHCNGYFEYFSVVASDSPTPGSDQRSFSELKLWP